MQSTITGLAALTGPAAGAAAIISMAGTAPAIASAAGAALFALEPAFNKINKRWRAVMYVRARPRNTIAWPSRRRPRHGTPFHRLVILFRKVRRNEKEIAICDYVAKWAQAVERDYIEGATVW